jgi:RHS repeat-associated protein
MVDSNATLRRHAAFDSFGNLEGNHITYYGADGDRIVGTQPWEHADAANSQFLYTGRLFDKDTGLQNNLNRWYNPAIGRWMSEDPIGFKGRDANLYRYVGNQPTNLVDSTGLAFIPGLPPERLPPADIPDCGSRRPIPPQIPESPDECPGPGWKKHPEGNWIKENEPWDETLHPDFDHPPGKPPHSDWKDNVGNRWELYPGLAPGGGYFPNPNKENDPRKRQPVFPPGNMPFPFPYANPPKPDPECTCNPTYGVPFMDDLSWRYRWFGY